MHVCVLMCARVDMCACHVLCLCTHAPVCATGSDLVEPNYSILLYVFTNHRAFGPACVCLRVCVCVSACICVPCAVGLWVFYDSE